MSDSPGPPSSPPRNDQPTFWSSRTAMDPVEQLAAELRSRWSRGDRARVEQCGPLFDAVSADVERLLDLIYHEILVREEHGERPEASDFSERFPELVGRISRLLGVHRAVGTEQQPRQEPERGPTPPDYEILQEVGRGGMAVVYRARQLSLHRIVALKMVATTREVSTEMSTRFRQEAQAVAQLQHANIVQIYEVGQVAGRPYLTLEFVAGGTLQGRLGGRPLTPENAARLIETLARAAHYAHRRGIVHRDLKPANILLETVDHVRVETLEASGESGLWLEDGPTGVEVFRPKISDFGLAKAAQFDSDLTVSGQILGTPGYMSPEQAAARGDAISAATDVYSLGAILYQLLTGRPPFHGSSMLDVLDQVRRDEPPPPRRLQPKVPRDLETICLHCLEKAPERRYATAEQLADDLRRFLEHVPITARRSGWLERSIKVVRRHPVVTALSLAVALSVIGGLAGIGWYSWQANEHARRARLDRARADRLREHADELRHKSQENFERLFDAVNGIRELGISYYQQPEQMTAGRTLLEFTVEYYDGFLHDESHDPKVREKAAVAFTNAGDVVGRMGDRERAAVFFERAIPLREQFVAAEPEEWKHHSALALVQRRLANARRHLDQRDKAAAAYQAAITSFERVLELRPTHDSARVALANSLMNEAALLIARRRDADAAERLAAAETRLREVVGRKGDVASRSELALCLDDQVDITWSLGNYALAQRQVDEAFQLWRELHEDGSAPVESARLLARSHVHRVRVYQHLQDGDRARAEAQRAVELMSKLVAENPLRVDVQQEFPDKLTCRAILLHDAGETIAAEKLLREAMDVSAGLVARFPEDPVIARALPLQQYWMGEFLWECGRTAEARTFFELALAAFHRAIEARPDSARAVNDLAWALATNPIDELVDASRARSMALRAMQIDPLDVMPYSILGVACCRLGDWPGAVVALSRTLRDGAFPRRIDLLFLGLAAHELGDETAARQWLERLDHSPTPSVFDLLEDRRLRQEVERLRTPTE